MSATLKAKITNKKAKIAVIGLGYVGLPLAVSFAKKGYDVFGLDKDEDRVNRVNAMTNYISDIKDADLKAVVSKQKLVASLDFEVLAHMDVMIICVPTPLKRKYTPDITYILSAVKTIRKYLRKNVLIVLESTTYPGTTEELILPELEKSKLKANKDFFLSFSPERIDPGNPDFKVTDIPKLVGGYGDKSGELTKILYEKIIKKVHLVSSPKAAEMTKLLENSFRIINIGWINEVAMMSHEMGIDIWEVIEAAKTKPFGFMPFYPGLGVGGHCIPDDPLYLYWKAKNHGFHSKFIKLSADINSEMPAYATLRIESLLKENKKKLKSAKLLVIGATYKKDVIDLRKSPALKLIEILQKQGATVDFHDPLIPYLKIGAIDQEGVDLTPANLKKYDMVIIATDHTKLDYKKVVANSKLIFDTKNILTKKKLSSKKIVNL